MLYLAICHLHRRGREFSGRPPVFLGLGLMAALSPHCPQRTMWGHGGPLWQYVFEQELLPWLLIAPEKDNVQPRQLCSLTFPVPGRRSPNQPPGAAFHPVLLCHFHFAQVSEEPIAEVLYPTTVPLVFYSVQVC